MDNNKIKYVNIKELKKDRPVEDYSIKDLLNIINRMNKLLLSGKWIINQEEINAFNYMSGYYDAICDEYWVEAGKYEEWKMKLSYMAQINLNKLYNCIIDCQDMSPNLYLKEFPEDYLSKSQLKRAEGLNNGTIRF